jgi:AraC family transcriptional regulator
MCGSGIKATSPSSDVSMARAARGLDMLWLKEVPSGYPGVLGFLMAREDGPPTVIRRPSLDCYLLGIGLNVATIQIDANGRNLRRGTYGLHGVHLVQPNQDADYAFTGKLVNFRLRLSVDAVASALEQMDRPSEGVELTDMPEQSDKALGSLCRRLLRATSSLYPDRLLIDCIMQTLVDRIIILNATRPASSRGRESLSLPKRRRVLDYIRTYYMRGLSLAELSAVAGLSRSHFLRAFRNAVGASPHAFLMMYRLHKSAEMMRQSTLALSDIAAATGFSSHAHMTTSFRQWTGFTPNELRVPARHGFQDEIGLLTP